MPRLFNLSRVRLRRNIYGGNAAPIGALGTIIQVLDGDSESPLYRVQLDSEMEHEVARGFTEEELEVIGAESVPEPVPSRSRTRWPTYLADSPVRFTPRFTPRTSPPPQEQAASDEYWDVGEQRAGRPPPTALPYPPGWLEVAMPTPPRMGTVTHMAEDEPEPQEESNASWNAAANEGPVPPRPVFHSRQYGDVGEHELVTLAMGGIWLDPGSRPVQEG